jgi:hypothetical protein
MRYGRAQQIPGGFQRLVWLAFICGCVGRWRSFTCPIFEAAGLALQPPRVFPFAPQGGFGSARRSASFWAASTITTEYERP